MVKKYTMEELDELPEFLDDEEDDDSDYEDYEDDTDDDEEDEPEDEVPESVTNHIVTFEEVLAADDTEEEKFYIKEWGGSVKVKGLTKHEFDQMRKKSRSPAARKSGRSSEILEREITIYGMVQPRIDVAKYNILMDKSAGVMLRILTRILDKSGLSEEADKTREKRFPRKR